MSTNCWTTATQTLLIDRARNVGSRTLFCKCILYTFCNMQYLYLCITTFLFLHMFLRWAHNPQLWQNRQPRGAGWPGVDESGLGVGCACMHWVWVVVGCFSALFIFQGYIHVPRDEIQGRICNVYLKRVAGSDGLHLRDLRLFKVFPILNSA